jgi:hypothetical protein
MTGLPRSERALLALPRALPALLRSYTAFPLEPIKRLSILSLTLGHMIALAKHMHNLRINLDDLVSCLSFLLSAFVERLRDLSDEVVWL